MAWYWITSIVYFAINTILAAVVLASVIHRRYRVGKAIWFTVRALFGALIIVMFEVIEYAIDKIRGVA